MSETIHYKQKGLFDPHAGKQPIIHIYGCGSIGSHVAIGLAKVGFGNLHLYDYDIVELSNIPSQFYTLEQGRRTPKKVDALWGNIMDFAAEDNTFTTNCSMIDEKFDFDVSKGSIHILAFDNIEARKIVAKAIQGYPVHLIDGRIGGFNYEKYNYMADEDLYSEYLKTLELNYSEQECGEKCLWAVNAILANKIVADVIKITKPKMCSRQVKGNLMDERVIEVR